MSFSFSNHVSAPHFVPQQMRQAATQPEWSHQERAPFSTQFPPQDLLLTELQKMMSMMMNEHHQQTSNFATLDRQMKSLREDLHDEVQSLRRDNTTVRQELLHLQRQISQGGGMGSKIGESSRPQRKTMPGYQYLRSPMHPIVFDISAEDHEKLNTAGREEAVKNIIRMRGTEENCYYGEIHSCKLQARKLTLNYKTISGCKDAILRKERIFDHLNIDKHTQEVGPGLWLYISPPLSYIHDPRFKTPMDLLHKWSDENGVSFFSAKWQQSKILVGMRFLHEARQVVYRGDLSFCGISANLL